MEKRCAIWRYKSLERWFDRSREYCYTFLPLVRSFPRSFLFEHYLDEETVVERGRERLRTIEKWQGGGTMRWSRQLALLPRGAGKKEPGQRKAEEKRYCTLHYRAACEGAISLYIGNSRNNRDVPDARASHKRIHRFSFNAQTNSRTKYLWTSSSVFKRQLIRKKESSKRSDSLF